MSAPPSNLALRRKISAPAHPFEQVGMSPPKALRIAFARVCEDFAKFESAVTEFAEDKMNLPTIVEDFASSDLILALKSKHGAEGLAIWDAQSTVAFIQQFVTGHVTKTVAEERVPTPSDGAILGRLLDRFLSDFDVELGHDTGAPPVRGFRKSSMFEDGRAVLMAMNDVEYRQYRLVLDLDNGAKTGALRLIFPLRAGAGNVPIAGGGAWQSDMRKSIASATAVVHTVLHRLAMPLSEITAFEIGTIVPIPAEVIGNVSLEGFDQKSVAAGRLGQSNGHRAVRVISGDAISVVTDPVQSFETAKLSPEMTALPPAGEAPADPIPEVEPIAAMQAAPMEIQLEDTEPSGPG